MCILWQHCCTQTLRWHQSTTKSNLSHQIHAFGTEIQRGQWSRQWKNTRNLTKQVEQTKEDEADIKDQKMTGKRPVVLQSINHRFKISQFWLQITQSTVTNYPIWKKQSYEQAALFISKLQCNLNKESLCIVGSPITPTYLIARNECETNNKHMSGATNCAAGRAGTPYTKAMYPCCSRPVSIPHMLFVASILNARQHQEETASYQHNTQKHLKKSKHYLLSLVAEKAFECENWSFLYLVLEWFGLNKDSIKCITTLNQNPTARIKINGGLTERMRLERGTRQGCCLSDHLFASQIELFTFSKINSSMI